MKNKLEDIPELDSHWNYRVIRRIRDSNGEKWVQFGIHEVYYSDGKPTMCSVEPDQPHGETLEELIEDAQHFQLALTKPTLNYEDF